MAALLQCLRDRLFRRLGLLPCGEGADSFHQVHAQLDAELMNLARCQFASCLVLCEPVLGSVSGLADVEWCEGTRMLRAGTREFDDVDGVGGGRSRFPWSLPLGHRLQSSAVLGFQTPLIGSLTLCSS